MRWSNFVTKMIINNLTKCLHYYFKFKMIEYSKLPLFFQKYI